MAGTEPFDALIVGAGQGGVPLTVALADAGWKTALVERAFVGGTCINTGCTPTKTMAASARVADTVHRASDFGVEAPSVRVDMRVVRARKRAMVERFRESTLSRIEASGARLVRGEARFVGEKEIAVALADGGTRRLTAPTIVLDTGARPRIPEVRGIDDVPYLDSTSVMELADVPHHLLVAGGGYIGVEFAQMFRRFGADVTIVDRGDQLLGHEDPDVASAVADILADDGVRLLLQSRLARLHDDGGDGVAADLEIADAQSETVRASHLLLAVGRVPNTEALHLDAGGIARDERGHIWVDDRLRTSTDGVYAIGDVKGGPAFTHISYDDYRIVAAQLLEGRAQRTTDRLVPYTVFLDPQLGRVGITEKQARHEGRNYAVARIPASAISRTVEVGRDRGLLKALVDPESQRILGVAVLAEQGGEIMAMLEIAMMADLPYPALRDGIFTHPTLAEGLNTLFSSVERA